MKDRTPKIHFSERKQGWTACGLNPAFTTANNADAWDKVTCKMCLRVFGAKERMATRSKDPLLSALDRLKARFLKQGMHSDAHPLLVESAWRDTMTTSPKSINFRSPQEG